MQSKQKLGVLPVMYVAAQTQSKLMVNGPYLKSAAKRRLPKRERIAFVRPRRTYCVWSVDFIRDALTYGQCFRTF